MDDYILQMKNITKKFGSVRALSDVTFSVRRGEIHALVGENGAGKSTLMKILSGLYPAGSYTGELVLNGEVQHFTSIKDSEKKGIVIINQELGLIKTMDICENLFLGNEILKNGIIQWNEQMRVTRELLERVHLNIDPKTKIIDMGAGKQQLVEIAKALGKNARLLILDEPTSSLTDADTENLLQTLRELKASGTTCIYISHKLGEIFSVTDTVTVLRDGRTITTLPTRELTEDSMVSYMVGRDLLDRFPRKEHQPGEVMLELKNWSVVNPDNPGKMLIDHVDLVARKGEILGIIGLMGAGRTELALSLLGEYTHTPDSELYLDGKRVAPKDPKQAIDCGISYVTEDRKRFGLVLDADLQHNISLASLRKLCGRGGFIRGNEEIKRCNDYVARMRIKTNSLMQKAKNLSGGNQQKVVLAKWLMTEPKVLILDEPTRGIDVGAKYEIYNLMNELADSGVCIIMISSEMPEALGMSDRLYVMHEGKIKGEMSWKEATQEKILSCAIGG